MNANVNMTRDEVIFVMKHDVQFYSAQTSKFLKTNFTTYNVALNTWLLIVEEGCGFRAARALKGAILAYGCKDTIKRCQEAANALIRGDGPLSDFTRELITTDERVTLQCLRYLKRFTPSGADRLNEASVERFLALNSSVRGLPSRILMDGHIVGYVTSAPRWLVARVRDYCHEMLAAYESPLWSQDFTNGTCAEGTKVRIEKLRILAEYQPNLFESPLYPIGKVSKTHKLDYVKIVPVPKNAEKARIIAETDAYSNYYLNGVRKSVESAMQKSPMGRRIHLDDQGVNQEMCRIGSIYNVYATIDLSGASDSIPDCFARAVLPKAVYMDVDKYNARALSYNGKRRRRFMFQTSGNPTTFCLESVIFLAICQVATDLCQDFLGYTCLQPVTYGDDMIVDVGVYDTVCDLLDLCGFTVNTEKSFSGDSDYRESCGVEYRSGVDLRTMYYPRKPITDDDESISSLIALQHRIFSYSYAEAWLTDFIKSRLRTKVKTVTSSAIASDCGDLWEYVPFTPLLNAPFDHSRMSECPVKREMHNVLEAKFEPVKGLNETDYDRLEVYYYALWLRDGAPTIGDSDDYASYLAHINHWTKSIKDEARDTGLPVYSWKTIKR